jgi:tetratricopeptide (TPR) repeat protein
MKSTIIKTLIFLSVFILCINYSKGGTNVYPVDSIMYSIHAERMNFLKKELRPYLKQVKPIKGSIKELTEDQKSVEAHIKNGDENLALENYKAAIRDYNLALDIDPVNSEALCHRANTKIGMHDQVNALFDYNLAIEADSESVELFYNRGNIQFELKEYSSAVDDYSKAIVLNAKDNRLYYNRAVAEYYLGKKELACKDFQKAMKLGDTNASVFVLELCK